MRSSSARWLELRKLAFRLEVLIEANSRLDAYKANPSGRPLERAEQVCKRLDRMAAQIGHQIDLITAERLMDEHYRRVRQVA